MTAKELAAAQLAELDRLAIEAAKMICRQGYKPAIAAKVVNLSDHAFAEVCEWYTASNADCRR